MLTFFVAFGLLLIGMLPISLTRYFDICALFEAHKATSCPLLEDDADGWESWVSRLDALEKRRLRSFILNMVWSFVGLLSIFVAVGMAHEAGEPIGLVLFLSAAFIFCLGAGNLRTFYSDESLLSILLSKKFPRVFA